MKKKISFGLVFALVLVSVSVIALAAGILFSPKVDASRIADRILEEKYGITLDMQTFLVRDEEELPDGTVRVTYSGWDQLEYILGTYIVDVKDGKGTASWSHDGENTAGGYDAEAWGAEQLKQMMADNQETGDMSRFLPQALAVAEKHNAAWQQPESAEEDAKAWGEQREKDKTAALEARRLSEEEMVSLARDAVVSRYELTEAQASLLELYTRLQSGSSSGLPYGEPANSWYEMVNGKPCFWVEYFLTQDPDHPEKHADKDGSYAVYVNVETGVIEEMVYNSGLGGEG